MDDNYDDLFEELYGERPEPVQEGQHFIDLDSHVPLPVQLPADEWVEIDAKDEFEVDGATAVSSIWSVKDENPFDVGDIEIVDGMHARAG